MKAFEPIVLEYEPYAVLVVGTDPARITEGYKQALNGYLRNFEIPPLWDGHAAERIVDILLDKLWGSKIVET